jgi:hypothetical protein
MQADTTVVTPASVGIIGFVVGYILKNLVPLVTSWIFKHYNTQRDSWYARQSDIVKMAVYTGATVAAMFLFSVVGLGWDDTFDPETLTPEFFQNLIVALISTFLVKVGIKTEKQRLGVDDA